MLQYFILFLQPAIHSETCHHFLWQAPKVKAPKMYIQSIKALVISRHWLLTLNKAGWFTHLVVLKKWNIYKIICFMYLLLLWVSHWHVRLGCFCFCRTLKMSNGARGVAFYNTERLLHAPLRRLCLAYFLYLSLFKIHSSPVIWCIACLSLCLKSRVSCPCLTFSCNALHFVSFAFFQNIEDHVAFVITVPTAMAIFLAVFVLVCIESIFKKLLRVFSLVIWACLVAMGYLFMFSGGIICPWDQVRCRWFVGGLICCIDTCGLLCNLFDSGEI